MLRRCARLLLMLLLVATVPAQSFAAATGRCDAGAPGGAAQASSANDVTAPAHPGHDGENQTSLVADAHCAMGVVIPSSIVPITPASPSGGVAPAVVAAPTGFVPDGIDRPPLTSLG